MTVLRVAAGTAKSVKKAQAGRHQLFGLARRPAYAFFTAS